MPRNPYFNSTTSLNPPPYSTYTNPSGGGSGTIPFKSATSPSTKPLVTLKPRYANVSSTTVKPVYSSGSIKPTYLSSGFGATAASTGKSIHYYPSVIYTYSPTGFTFAGSSVLPSGSKNSSLITVSPTTSPTLCSPISSSSAVSNTSTSIAPSVTPFTFQLQIFGTADYVPNPGLDGSYITVHPDKTSQDALKLTSNAIEASVFTLNTDGTLQSGHEIAGIHAGTSYDYLLMQTGAAITGGFDKSVCQIVGDMLSCQTGRNVEFFTCDPAPDRQVEIGPTGRPNNAGCWDFALLVVPA